MGTQGGPVLRVLGTVLGTYTHSNHHRHPQHTGAHTLPLGQLVEQLIAGAAEEISVHDLRYHTTAAHGIANGCTHNGRFTNGRVE